MITRGSQSWGSRERGHWHKLVETYLFKVYKYLNGLVGVFTVPDAFIMHYYFSIFNKIGWNTWRRNNWIHGIKALSIGNLTIFWGFHTWRVTYGTPFTKPPTVRPSRRLSVSGLLYLRNRNLDRWNPNRTWPVFFLYLLWNICRWCISRM